MCVVVRIIGVSMTAQLQEVATTIGNIFLATCGPIKLTPIVRIVEMTPDNQHHNQSTHSVPQIITVLTSHPLANAILTIGLHGRLKPIQKFGRHLLLPLLKLMSV